MPIRRIVRRIEQTIIILMDTEAEGVGRGEPARVPSGLEIDTRPAGTVQDRDAAGVGEAGVSRRGRRWKSLLVLVKTVHRTHRLEIPILARITPYGKAMREVLLSQIVVSRRESGLAGERGMARRVEVRIDAGVSIVVPEAERVRGSNHRCQIVRELELRIRHPRMKQSGRTQ